MTIDVDAQEIRLNAEETRDFGAMYTDERGTYAYQIAQELHKLHPDLPRDRRFTVVNAGNAICFFTFTY